MDGDGQREFSSLDHVCIPCSTVKINISSKPVNQLTQVLCVCLDPLCGFEGDLVTMSYISKVTADATLDF